MKHTKTNIKKSKEVITGEHIEFVKKAMLEVNIDPDSKFGKEFIKLEKQVIYLCQKKG